jgi:hypothetical protein
MNFYIIYKFCIYIILQNLQNKNNKNTLNKILYIYTFTYNKSFKIFKKYANHGRETVI